MRPFEFITKLKIRKAKEMLVGDRRDSIDSIAKHLGYHDTSYFCLIFKTLESVTPLQFRKLYRSEQD